jgi:hypothetical protein
VPYTDEIRRENDLERSDLERLQFYTSHDINLQRIQKKEDAKIVGHKLETVSGQKVDEFSIPAITPARLIDNPDSSTLPDSLKLTTRFSKEDSHALQFGFDVSAGGKYVLLASKWQNGLGIVHYAGKEYYTDKGSKGTYLMVDARKIERMKKKHHKEKGARF